MNSRQDEDDRVQRLLSLLDPAKEPESSDHVHDDTLALLTGGMASEGELAAVRAHLVVCPPCRRLVGQILGDSERSHPEVRPARTWGWLGRPPAILAWAVAACLLLGVTVVIWSLNRGGGAPRPGPQPGPDNAPLWAELLAATVTWERSGPRGIEPERSPITLKIDSPQDGIAVVVMVANGRWELLRGERPMKKGPGNDYGPIESLPAPVDYIVVLSDRQERGELSRTIGESLPSEPRDIEAHYETWRDDVRARLTRGGHRWVAVEPVRVVPTKPDPAERPAPASRRAYEKAARTSPGRASLPASRYAERARTAPRPPDPVAFADTGWKPVPRGEARPSVGRASPRICTTSVWCKMGTRLNMEVSTCKASPNSFVQLALCPASPNPRSVTPRGSGRNASVPGTKWRPKFGAKPLARDACLSGPREWGSREYRAPLRARDTRSFQFESFLGRASWLWTAN